MRLEIQVWSDIACPWCFVGKRHLEQALAKFPQRGQVDVRWRAFELDPSAPRPAPGAPWPSAAERLARKYGMPVAAAQARLAEMTARGAGEGIAFRFDRLHPTNTFDGHRLLHLAAKEGAASGGGRQNALKERLLQAYFEEGEDLGDATVLTRLAVEAGLPPEAVRTALASDSGAAEVRRDESTAQQLGIGGVPFFLIGRYGVSGAQPAEALLKVLEAAWAEADPTAAVSSPAQAS